jgi:hypothetical protein
MRGVQRSLFYAPIISAASVFSFSTFVCLFIARVETISSCQASENYELLYFLLYNGALK